uniref:Ubiquitin ligase protein COP1 n=1 Tax=Arundo donax TaxID=35708 RepID=A0A0A9G3K7_ARUDO
MLFILHHTLAGLDIPNSYYALIITACNNIFRVLVPAEAAEFRSSSHFNNRAMHVRWFINNARKFEDFNTLRDSSSSE